MMAFWFTLPIQLASYFISQSGVWIFIVVGFMAPSQGFLNALIYFQRSGGFRQFDFFVKAHQILNRRLSSLFNRNTNAILTGVDPSTHEFRKTGNHGGHPDEDTEDPQQDSKIAEQYQRPPSGSRRSSHPQERQSSLDDRVSQASSQRHNVLCAALEVAKDSLDDNPHESMSSIFRSNAFLSLGSSVVAEANQETAAPTGPHSIPPPESESDACDWREQSASSWVDFNNDLESRATNSIRSDQRSMADSMAWNWRRPRSPSGRHHPEDLDAVFQTEAMFAATREFFELNYMNEPGETPAEERMEQSNRLTRFGFPRLRN